MRRAWVRSTIFNLAFYLMNAAACVVLVPFFFLPRKAVLGMVAVYLRAIMALEYGILGLRYEVRGKENLPAEGSFIVAAKHQSPYETFKLHVIFRDPAVVLKQELLKIPLWGTYLKKTDVIAIDRSSPEKAITSMQEGALRMKQQGRPIIIFPQGTRVNPEETAQHRPYKIGVMRIQEATGLPIVPMALNAGLFWPRKGWLKSPGTVVFEFLKPVAPGGNPSETIRAIEAQVEEASAALMNEARMKDFERYAKRGPAQIFMMLFFAAAFFSAYSFLWFETEKRVLQAYDDFKAGLGLIDATQVRPAISGYPGPLRISVPQEKLATEEGSITISNAVVTAWPLPLLPIHLQSGELAVQSFRWSAPLVFESFAADIRVLGNILHIDKSRISRENFEAGAEGTIDIAQKPFPRFDLMIRLKDHGSLMLYLAEQKIIDTRSALFMTAALAAFAKDGVVEAPLVQREDTLYVGPLAVAKLPSDAPPNRLSPDAVTEFPPAPAP